MNKWEKFSHITRTFLTDRPIAKDLDDEIRSILDANADHMRKYVIITDPELIESIYQVSDIPDETVNGINYKKRKNSQIIAPYMIIFITEEGNPDHAFSQGRLQAEIGFKAIDKSYETAFCLCFDNDAVNELLWERNLLERLNEGKTEGDEVPGSTALFMIGTRDPKVLYNYSQRDKMIVTALKRVPVDNVTVI